MQKKLYFLNEEEKNRILNLHEGATKKQYLLSEQKYEFSTQKTTQTSTAEQKKFYDREKRVKALDSKCSNITPNDKNPLYKKLGDWMDFVGTGFSWGTGQLEGILKEINTLEKYCEISATLKLRGTPKGRNKESIGEYLLRRIQFMDSWTQYFENPLSTVLKEVGLDTSDSPTTTEEPIKTTPEQSKGVEGLMKDIISKDKERMKQTPTQQQLPNYGGVTKSVQSQIPNLLKTIGSTDTTLTQDSINKIYNFLTKA